MCDSCCVMYGNGTNPYACVYPRIYCRSLGLGLPVLPQIQTNLSLAGGGVNHNHVLLYVSGLFVPSQVSAILHPAVGRSLALVLFFVL